MGCVDAICGAEGNEWFSRLSSLDLMVRSGTHLTILKVVVAIAANVRSFTLNSTVDLDEDIVRSVLQWNNFERLFSHHIYCHFSSLQQLSLDQRSESRNFGKAAWYRVTSVVGDTVFVDFSMRIVPMT